MKKLPLFAISALCVILAGFPVAAKEGKTGYVHMESVFNAYYKTINENISFEAKRKTMIDGFALLREELKTTAGELQKAKEEVENELLAPEVRENARNRAMLYARRVEQKQEELYKFRQQEMGQIESRQQAVLAELIKELTAILDKYARDNGYAQVFEVSGRTMNQMPAVLVYPHEDDITEALIKLVNAGHEQEKAEAEAKLKSMREKSAAAAREAGLLGPNAEAGK